MTASFQQRNDLIQVTYRLLSDKLIDPEKKATLLALGQTTDTWTPNALSGHQKLAAHRGVVLGMDERTHVEGKPYEYYLRIGYPVANTENDIPTLLTMIFGKPSLDGAIRLVDLQLPAAFLKNKGPRFGIDGIRQKVGEPAKPLTMAIFKPGVGLTPAELGRMFLELALGGIHLVKDDEILPNIDICPTEKRLEACLKAADQAQKTTGRRTLYAVNLTGPVSQLPARAKRLAKLGAECFLFNVLSYGYGALEELREAGIPIMAHPALSGAICGAPDTGISYPVILGTLMRAGGADIVLFPSSYGTVALPESETRAIRLALTTSLDGVQPVFPAPSAGIHPGLVPRILKEYGHDVIINAGGGVHGHPGGPLKGAKAFRQAIDWTLRRGNFGGLSEREFPELAAALRLWGKG